MELMLRNYNISFSFQASRPNTEEEMLPEKKKGTVWFRPVGMLKFMSLEKLAGKVCFHLRQYKKEKTGKLALQGQREVALNKAQVRDLLNCLPGASTALLMALGEIVDEEVTPLFDEDGMIDDDDDIDVDKSFCEHIGRNVFVRVAPGKKFVDIREFYVKKGVTDPQPSLKGVTLNKKELAQVMNDLPELTELWRGLAELVPCHLTHQNQEGFHQCPHCNPDGQDETNFDQ